MLQLTWKFVYVDIELESKGLEFYHLEIESIGLDLVLLQELIKDFAFLFFLSFFYFLHIRVLTVPLSTSKPQKPMNKTKYKPQNKYLIGSDLLL